MIHSQKGKIAATLITLASALVLGYFISQYQFLGLGIVGTIPLVVAYFYFTVKHEKFGLYLILILSFGLAFLGRNFPSEIPYGLSIDVVLVLSLILLIFKHYKTLNLKRLNHPIFWLMLIWMAYITLQIFNPLAYSFTAWFYSMRGIALYQTLTFILLFLTFETKKDLKPFFNIWLAFSVLGVLWGIKQNTFGVSGVEQRWLNEGGAVTHILFGKLRVFSYYFDAGTFGAAMGQVSLICAILTTNSKFTFQKRVFFGGLALLFFYGLMISGTRGALAVPGAGAIIFLILAKKIKILIPGLLIITLGFSFLKFTHIGQSNYTINRLRTALDPNDASLQVRFKNRDRLTEYLKGKPFGCGIGTTGSWGKRFSPGTWLADFEPDGLYTRLRAESGVVGRNLYVGIWLTLLIWSIKLSWETKEGPNKLIAIAFISSFAGVLLANYGNSVLTQHPISITTFLSLFFAFQILQSLDKKTIQRPLKE